MKNHKRKIKKLMPKSKKDVPTTSEHSNKEAVKNAESSQSLHAAKIANESDTVVRVFIEEKKVTAYKTPLVSKPDAKMADIKTYGKENYPTQSQSKLPDVFPELSDEARAYLKMWPYGDNLVINRKQISQLYKFYFEARELPLPSSTINAFKEHMDLLRNILNLCTMDEMEEQELAQGFESSYPRYTCKCNDKKKVK